MFKQLNDILTQRMENRDQTLVTREEERKEERERDREEEEEVKD